MLHVLYMTPHTNGSFSISLCRMNSFKPMTSVCLLLIGIVSTFAEATIRCGASAGHTTMKSLRKFDIKLPPALILFARLMAELLYGGKSANLAHAWQHSLLKQVHLQCAICSDVLLPIA